jgi:hypothetical protein
MVQRIAVIAAPMSAIGAKRTFKETVCEQLSQLGTTSEPGIFGYCAYLTALK